MERSYNYALGIKVGNSVLPDPASWNYQVGDLDTSGSRDATGLLHRAYVATKINYEFEWHALEWEMLEYILHAEQAEKFTLTAPDPRTFSSAYTGDYYVGDRTGKNYYFRADGNYSGSGSSQSNSAAPVKAAFDLKLKFIEY